MAERLGESRNDASDTNNSNRTQRQPKNVVAHGGQAVETAAREAGTGKARGGEKQQVSAAGKGRGGSAGAGAVQAVQDRVGSDRRAYSERPFCPKSHRVPGPVRGFKKMRRAPWVRLRRVEE
jgi:hypothetical protein